MFKNQNVLITGGGGMIGRSLVKFLHEKGANITIVDLTKPIGIPDDVGFIKTDLRYFDKCEQICKGKDYVFNLVGVKGSPKMCAEQPADFFVPMLQFNTNMMEAARRADVKWYLYTSSVGVYNPAEIFHEDDTIGTVPSKNDWFAGWAKRMGELQAEAYSIQYGWDKVSIVRPANVYGDFDNFNPDNAMVIPSLIRKALENDVMDVWGDGTTIRDFIHSDDVALGMIFAVENGINQPLNLGSGTGVSIKEIVDIISNYVTKKKSLGVNWLTDKQGGDLIRILSTERIRGYGFDNTVSLRDGIEQTIDWFVNNKEILDKRYNTFVNH